MMRQTRIAIILVLIVYECTSNAPPIFINDMNNLAISENVPIGTIIYTLEAKDPESQQLSFSLKGTDLLRVDEESGEVFVVKPLDREVNDTLSVIVGVKENSDNFDSNFVELPASIIVLDENDNSPEFMKLSYTMMIFEDTPIGSTLSDHIFVTDKDSIGASIEVECLNVPKYFSACDFFAIETINSSHDFYDGVIVLIQPLNYSIQQQYHFLLKASDGDLSGVTQITVNIGDVENMPPRFHGQLEAEIFENVPINTLVLTVQAEDGDRGINRRVIYELNNNPMNYFVLDPISGELRTAKPLNREAVNSSNGVIILSITAYEVENGYRLEDPLTMSEAKAIIRIKDINDVAPIFNQREYFVNVPENITENSIIPNLDMFITDPDEDNNSIFALYLNDISGAFSIQPHEAIGYTQANLFVMNNRLDYEDLSQRKFIVLAVAKELYTEEKLSSTATITITLTDINDNTPRFAQSNYSTIIEELNNSNDTIITITAKDGDSGSFGENGIIYELSGNTSKLFIVNNRTGSISIAPCATIGRSPCLDYEEQREHHLKFTAIDDNGRGHRTTVPLTIFLVDANDNSPKFSKDVYNVEINESTARFQPDLFINAKDADMSSEVRYSLYSSNSPNLFSIDSKTGKLRIMSHLGLKVGTENPIIKVTATDGNFTTHATVNITIKDVNDNPPIFTETLYETHIEEDVPIGTVVIHAKAIDHDYGSNADIDYSLTKGHFNDFQINSISGIVRTASNLDYDKRKVYNIEILAMDHGYPNSLTATTTLTVHIENVNNKNPFFIPQLQKAEVLENSPIGTIVHNLTASDLDTTNPNALLYFLSDSITAMDKFGNLVKYSNDFSKFFSVNMLTGHVIVSNKLERDVAAEVRLNVIVRDGSAPNLQEGNGLLIVTIIDVNDSPPTFLTPWTIDDPVYHLTIREELPVGTIVATYEAVDLDSDISGYAIVPENQYFQVNSGTGIVQIKKKIDYEHITNLNFTLYAFDSGVPQLNSSTLVLVQIINLNDNDPIFEHNAYNASIDENTIVGTKIIKVSATDKDVGDYGKVTYSIQGESTKYFRISEYGGVISIFDSNFLDHEQRNSTTLTIVAEDNGIGGGKRSSTSTLTITIRDVNDNKPKFNQSVYNTTVLKNVRLNPLVPILQLNATDIDSGINGLVHYKILSGNRNDIFILGVESGILYPHKSLLRETEDFQLRIEARDEAGHGSFIDYAIVNIVLQNINEYKPVFINPKNSNAIFKVLNNKYNGSRLITTIHANDEDEGESGSVSYHIKINSKHVQAYDVFHINSTSGELFFNLSDVHHEKNKIRYMLTIVARDHGMPKWFESVVNITILLIDINSNNPEFHDIEEMKAHYHFFIAENEPNDTKIGQVQTVNKDDSAYMDVYYYIISGNNESTFYIDKANGKIYSNKSLDREYKEEYHIYVLACIDPDFYPYSSQIDKFNKSVASVKISVRDLNDNGPRFKKSIYYSAINVQSNINSMVLNVSAIDPDLRENGSLNYYLRSTDLYKYGSNESFGSIIPSPFNISRVGEITTTMSLKEHNQQRFVIEIIAQEQAYPRREDVTKVNVWIFDPEQLIKIVISKSSHEVLNTQNVILSELQNATQNVIILDKIKHHVAKNNAQTGNWSDMLILMIDNKSKTIVPVPDVLKGIDSQFDFLKDYYASFAIENVLPAYATEASDVFDPAFIALLALLIVLFIGSVTFTVICCCLKHWLISPSEHLKHKRDGLIKKAIINELNTTDNPLWIEQKIKMYEEQELTMQVFTENDAKTMQRSNDQFSSPDDNTYATIQHPNRRPSLHISTMNLDDDIADYATLSRDNYSINNSYERYHGTSNYYEAALGLQGSTFQVPDKGVNNMNNYDIYGAHLRGSELTINREGQPEYIAEIN